MHLLSISGDRHKIITPILFNTLSELLSLTEKWVVLNDLPPPEIHLPEL